MAKGIGEDLEAFLDAMGVEVRGGKVVHPRTGALEDAAAYARRIASLYEQQTGADEALLLTEDIIDPPGAVRRANLPLRIRASMALEQLRMSPAAKAAARQNELANAQRMGRGLSPFSAEDVSREGIERSSKLMRQLYRQAPKALATGLAAKLMLGGAAKAAGLPGVGEAAEMAGREDPSLQQFFREQEEGITGALGLPQRSQMPVYSMDPAREGAARVMLRTGRENLRPGFDQPPITKQELEYVKKKAAPRAK